jgi:CubicO group peptidase (beta-lactamase class C family)
MKVLMLIDRRASLGLLAAGAVMTGAGAAHADPTPFQAYLDSWTGTLNAGPVALRLKLIIASPTEASLISLDQGSAVIPATKISLGPDKLWLEFEIISARYEATLVDKDSLSGMFTQGGKAMPLSLKRGDQFTANFKPEVLSQALLTQYRQKAGTPAMGAAFARKDGPVTIYVDGLRSADDKIAVTRTDKWHLGSITKSMTATLVARLVEKGVVQWDTRVGDVLGARVAGMNPVYADATLLHLLSHRAGLQPNIDGADLIRFTRDNLADARSDRLAYATLALRQEPAAKLAEKMIYANNGYIVAGALIETLTEKPWETLIFEEVFTPLGITSAGFGAPGTKGLLDQPVGHAPALLDAKKRKAMMPGTGVTTDNPTALGPAGRVHMNLADLMIFLRAHLLQPEAFLKRDTFRTLHTPPFGGNYALGWVVSEGGRLWHNGSNTIWYAEVGIDPITGLIGAVTANDADQTSTMPAVNALLRSARDAV